MKDSIVAVDLGGTQVRVALCDAAGRIINRTAQLTCSDQGPEAIFCRIVAGIREVGGDFSGVGGIGVSAPGPVNPWQGIILEAPNLPGMVNFAMKARLEQKFPVPTFVGNDANLAALGEQRYGAGRGVAYMIYLTISTGIGGGIIADNELYLGSRGLAGEVGHQTFDVNGPICNCGNIGCFEVLAAGPGIARRARELLNAGRESKMRALVDGDVDRVTAKTVTQAAREEDTLACEIVERTGVLIGLGMVNLLHNFDTQLFVIGGGVAINAWDLLYPHMLATLRKHAFPSMSKGVQILPAQLGDDAGLLGAAALAMDSVTVRP